LNVELWVDGGGILKTPGVRHLKVGLHKRLENGVKTGEKYMNVTMDNRETVFFVTLVNVSERN